MDVVRCLHAGGNISHKRMEDDEERLFNHLFENYNPRLRPVLKKSEAVNVTFGISLHQIIDVVSLQFRAVLTVFFLSCAFSAVQK